MRQVRAGSRQRIGVARHLIRLGKGATDRDGLFLGKRSVRFHWRSSCAQAGRRCVGAPPSADMPKNLPSAWIAGRRVVMGISFAAPVKALWSDQALRGANSANSGVK